MAGYPWIPAAYIGAATALVGYTISDHFYQFFLSLLIMLAGIPVYYLISRKFAKTANRAAIEAHAPEVTAVES
jgi:Zn-dependent protease with chaperone function